MIMEIKFRKADIGDIPVIAQLADAIWRKHYPSIISIAQIDYMLKEMYSQQALQEQMKEGHQFTLVYVNEIPSGYISVSSHDRRNYYINKFYVDVNEHRKGIGSLLLQHIIKQLPDAETFELAVNRENYKAVNFYFKNGFTIKHSFDLHIGNGFYMNDYMMEKKLKC